MREGRDYFKHWKEKGAGSTTTFVLLWLFAAFYMRSIVNSNLLNYCPILVRNNDEIVSQYSENDGSIFIRVCE